MGVVALKRAGLVLTFRTVYSARLEDSSSVGSRPSVGSNLGRDTCVLEQDTLL